jgi:hypothetical protein
MEVWLMLMNATMGRCKSVHLSILRPELVHRRI